MAEDRWLAATVTCKRCDRKVDGGLKLDGHNCIADSYGFVVMEDGAICMECIEASR
jgi:hypothetical protein